MHDTPDGGIDRRTFVRAIGLGGMAAVGATGLGAAAHVDEANVVFPDQPALRPTDQSRGPFQAAVALEDLVLPDGGWVVISERRNEPLDTMVGRTATRLGPGHWKRFLNQVSVLDEGTHDLWASLYGEGGDAREDFPGEPYGVQDSAQVTF